MSLFLYALTLFVGGQEEHPAWKNYCFKASLDFVMAVNVSVQVQVKYHTHLYNRQLTITSSVIGKETTGHAFVI